MTINQTGGNKQRPDSQKNRQQDHEQEAAVKEVINSV